MQSLDSLLASESARRQRNLSRLASMTARLDVQDFTPSTEAPAERRSTPEPMPTGPAPDDAEFLRQLLPRRSDPSAGGDFGSAIVERVARNYGLR